MNTNEENPKNENESENDESKIIFLSSTWTNNIFIDWDLKKGELPASPDDEK